MKDELIKARVSTQMKEAIAHIAEARGESEAVIIREALNTLVLKDSPPSTPIDLSKTTPVSYLKTAKRKPRKK